MKTDSSDRAIRIRRRCVLCNSKKVSTVLDFKATPLANSYITTKKEEFFAPLVCIQCDDCKHVQLKYLVNPKIMFDHYMYVSGTSKVLVNHFKNYANKIIKKKKLIKKKDKILDIACNDGTFLDFFVKKGFKKVVGIEPAKNLKSHNLEKKIDINTIYFNYKNSYKLKKKYRNFKIITANNVFAHVPDLKDFAMGVKNLLDKDGLFIFEVSYLKDVIKKMTFDTIYHEHMSYHSLKPLINFFRSLKLDVLDFDLIKAQGGSIRVYVGHLGRKTNSLKIKKQIEIEKKSGLFNKKTFNNYYKNIIKYKKKLKKLVNNIKENKKVLVGYGSPAKVTTFTYVFDLSNKDIKFIVDDNKLKQGKLTPGKNIKITNFEQLHKSKFDYIVILAWNFSESIIFKLNKTFKKRRFKIIIPFPNLKII